MHQPALAVEAARRPASALGKMPRQPRRRRASARCRRARRRCAAQPGGLRSSSSSGLRIASSPRLAAAGAAEAGGKVATGGRRAWVRRRMTTAERTAAHVHGGRQRAVGGTTSSLWTIIPPSRTNLPSRQHRDAHWLGWSIEGASSSHAIAFGTTSATPTRKGTARPVARLCSVLELVAEAEDLLGVSRTMRPESGFASTQAAALALETGLRRDRSPAWRSDPTGSAVPARNVRRAHDPTRTATVQNGGAVCVQHGRPARLIRYFGKILTEIR